MSTHRLKFVSVLCALVGCYGGGESPSSTADEIRYNPYANHCWRVCRADVPCDTRCVDGEYFDSTCAAWGACLPSTSATISASPERVEVVRGTLGYTTISWHTTGASDARVYVNMDGGPAQLFAQSPSGSQGASWIQAGHVYEFTLVLEGHTGSAASVRVEGVERPEPCGQVGQAPSASGCCAGFAACGGVCLDPFTDASNCGCCGRVCAAPANASPVCRAGGCDFECHAGFARSGAACVSTPAPDPCANVRCPPRYICTYGFCEPIGGGYPPPEPL
jgi:hypothetical protein